MSEIDRLYRRFVRTGDREALATLYDRVAPDLLLVASHRLGDADAAEDAVHNAFMSVLERRGRHDESRPVRPWLMGAVINQGRLHLRADARRVDPRRTEPAAPADPGEVAAAEELVRAVHESVARLPDTYRTVLDLRLRRGLAPHEIAARLDRPAATVRSQLARGLAEVRRALPPGFAATVTVLVASEASAAASRAATITAAGAASAAVVGAPVKLGAICFAVGLAVALPLTILAGRAPDLEPDRIDADRALLRTASSLDPAAPLPPVVAASAGRGAAAGAAFAPPAATLPATTDAPASAETAGAAGDWVLTGRVCEWVAVLGQEAPPIPRCHLELHLSYSAIRDGPHNVAFAVAETDAHGHYRIDLNALKKLDPRRLAGTEVHIFAHASGFAGRSTVDGFPTDARKPFHAKDRMLLERGAVLRGRVVGSDGQLIRDGYAGFADPECEDSFDEYELVDGCYRLIVRETGRVWVRAVVAERGVSRDLPVDVLEFGSYDLPDLVLEDGAVIEGQAVFPDGRPARDLVLEYDQENRRRYTRWRECGTVTTDADGRFRVAGLDRDRYILEPDLDFTDRIRTRIEAGRPATVFRIGAPVIVVRMLDQHGRSRTNVPLRLLGWSDANATRAEAIWRAGGDLRAMRSTACFYNDWGVDRRSGMLSFAVPPDSFWILRSQLPNQRAVEHAVRVTPGRYDYRVDLSFLPLRRPGRLGITVRGPGGESIKRFHVTLAPAHTGIPLPRLSNALFGAGRGVPGLTPGRYRLRVVPLQRALRTEVDRNERATLLPATRVVEVKEGDNPVEIETTLGARLLVRMHAPHATKAINMPWCDLQIIGADGTRRVRGVRFYKVLKNGGLRLREKLVASSKLMASCRFRPGTRRLRFRFTGYEPVEVAIPFEAGRVHETELHLRPAPVTPARAPRAPRRSAASPDRG